MPSSDYFCDLEIEAQVLALQAKTKNLTAEEVDEADKVGLGQGGHFDTDIYDDPTSKFHGYARSIATTDEIEVCIDSCYWFIHSCYV